MAESHGDIVVSFSTNLKVKNWPWAGSHQNPLTVQFTDQSLGEPDSWYWDFGDDEFSREQNPTKTFLAPIGRICLWAWKDASESLMSYSSNTGNYRDGWNNPEPEWKDQWTKVKALPGVELGMVVERKATVEPFSTSKRVQLAYTILTRDFTGYAPTDRDNFLVLLSTSGTFNAFTHWDAVGNAPAAGMTISMFDSSMGRIKNDLTYRRDYNLGSQLDVKGVCLGDVGNLGSNEQYSTTVFTWMDWAEDPYKDFEEMPPDWLPNWPTTHNTAVGYWGNVLQTCELKRFYNCDDWGKRCVDFSKYPIDFVGSPRVGVAMLTVQFIDLSVVTIDEWDWDFGDGTISGVTAGSTHQHPVHMYNYDA